jgi:ABC-type transport system involved in multi-copper enzyme maturation permease subunit
VTLLGSAAPQPAYRPATTVIWQVRAEIMKIRTTSTWWLFLSGVVVFTALALWTNGVSHHFTLYPPLGTMNAADRAQAIAQAAQARTPAGRAAIATTMMTSGQFFGVLFAMLIGVLAVTNEFAHQTATATFLANPRRTTVIMAKLTAAGGFGALFWLASTVIDAVVTPIYLHSQHVSFPLTGWIVVRSVLLNLLAYVMWAVFGLGLGAMIRSQIAAVITGLASYLAGFAAVEIIFHLIYSVYRHGWVLGAPVIAPAVASMVMITPGRAFAHAPPQWAGVVIMACYAVVLAALGIALTRRRDVT